MTTKRLPYLTIAITNACNFRCNYCSPDGKGGFGEGFKTKTKKTNFSDLEKKIKIAEEEGIEKIRITGGEPLVVKGIVDLLKFLEKETNLKYALATNGSLVHKHIDDLKYLSRMDLRISLDTLDENKFDKICGVKNQYKQVMRNIRELAEQKILNRVATVVTRDNVHEIEDIIDFCEELGINLKLFDMYATTKTRELWKNLYSPMQIAKKEVEKKAIKTRQVGYTKHFGIPSLEYELKSRTLIRIKDSQSGTRFSEEFCPDCNNLPCQEGLYTILYSSDQKLIPCRLSHTHFKAETTNEFRTNLKKLINIFQEAYHDNKFWSDKYAESK
ncbi:radical SAM protein [Candidatus Woesearchaeota archaeon]|nr:radical SAM protein [Candidatus Woesearchaeota archaeon]